MFDLHSELIQIGWTVIHLLWVGMAIGCMCWLADSLLANRSSKSRYAANCIGLLALLVSVPVAFLFSRPPVENPPVRAQLASSSRLQPLDDDFAVPIVWVPEGARRSAEAGLPPIRSTDIVVRQSDSSAVGRNGWTTVESLGTMSDWPLFVAIVYCIGVGCMMSRLLIASFGIGRIRLRSRPAEARWQRLIERQAVRIGLRKGPELKLCDGIRIPTVVGTVRPFLLMPASMLTGLRNSEIENIVLHELAHLRRYDHYWVILQRLAESILFFHPVVWYLRHRIETEREHCCDDLVVSSGIPPHEYATTLCRVAEWHLAEHRLSIGLAVDGHDPSQLRLRIQRLLDSSPTSGFRFGFSSLGCLVLLGSIVVATVMANDSTTNDDSPAVVKSPPVVKPVTTPQLAPLDSALAINDGEPDELRSGAVGVLQLTPVVPTTLVEDTGSTEAVPDFVTVVAAVKPSSSSVVAEKVEEVAAKAIRGTIVDHLGQPVPGAELILKRDYERRPENVLETRTDDKGRFEFETPEISDNRYRIDYFIWIYSAKHGVDCVKVFNNRAENEDEKGWKFNRFEDVHQLEKATVYRVKFFSPKENIEGGVYPVKVFGKKLVRLSAAAPKLAAVDAPVIPYLGEHWGSIEIPKRFRQLTQQSTDENGVVEFTTCNCPTAFRVMTEPGFWQRGEPYPLGLEMGVRVRRYGWVEGQVDRFDLIRDENPLVDCGRSHGFIRKDEEPVRVKFDASGRFRVPAGWGFAKFRLSKDVENSAHMLTAPTLIKVLPDKTSYLRLNVVEAAVVRGRALLPDRTPLVNLPLSISVDDSKSYIAHRYEQVKTDAAGQFSVFLPPTKLRGVSCGELSTELAKDYSRSDLTRSLRFQPGITLSAGRVYDHLAMTLEKCGQIKGTVLDSKGRPVANAYVNTRSFKRQVAQTDANGKFVLQVSQYSLKWPAMSPLIVATENQYWVAPRVEARDPYVLRMPPDVVIAETKRDETRAALMRGVGPITRDEASLVSVLSTVARFASFEFDKQAFDEVGIDPSQLKTALHLEHGMVLQAVLDKILTPMNLTWAEADKSDAGWYGSRRKAVFTIRPVK